MFSQYLKFRTHLWIIVAHEGILINYIFELIRWRKKTCMRFSYKDHHGIKKGIVNTLKVTGRITINTLSVLVGYDQSYYETFPFIFVNQVNITLFSLVIQIMILLYLWNQRYWHHRSRITALYILFCDYSWKDIQIIIMVIRIIIIILLYQNLFSRFSSMMF